MLMDLFSVVSLGHANPVAATNVLAMAERRSSDGWILFRAL